MNSEMAWNMFVFRDGRSAVAGPTLARDLADSIRRIFSVPPTEAEDQLIDALLRAGELECALTDAGDPRADQVSRLTDALADALAGDGLAERYEQLFELIPESLPEQLKTSPPEGFAYYALHPMDYVDMACSLAARSGTAGVIGIRSIGVTLSALVAAALRRKGLEVVRTTVRPHGHPYDRVTKLSDVQTRVVQELISADADFVIADEGPGMSGSSFLSAGDALVEAGAQRERITFLCSRVPDPDKLRAKDAGRRWHSYRALYAKKNSRLPEDASLYIGGGEWRSVFPAIGGPSFAVEGGSPGSWPASWTQMERLKFLSRDRRLIMKFEGFGRFGRAVHERSTAVALEGFGPMPLEFSKGFSTFPVVQGRPGHSTDLSSPLLKQMARYCVFRQTEFRATGGQDSAQLESMVRFNLAEEFGVDWEIDSGSLETTAPVIVDGRMMPHEWIGSQMGFIKVDNASHGDDHFFPGPTDIAWDLAGSIVEWEMDQETAKAFIAEYEKLSSRRATERLEWYVMAYAVFRLGYCKMAAAAMQNSGEDERLHAAYLRYRAYVSAKLGNLVAPLAA